MPDAQQLLTQVQEFPHMPVLPTAILLGWQVPLRDDGGELTQHLVEGGWHCVIAEHGQPTPLPLAPVVQPEAACEAGGTTISEMTGKAAIDTSPTLRITSRRVIPANGEA